MGTYRRRVWRMTALITRFASHPSCDVIQVGSLRRAAQHNTQKMQAMTTCPSAAPYPLLSHTHTVSHSTTTSTTLTTGFFAVTTRRETETTTIRAGNHVVCRVVILPRVHLRFHEFTPLESPPPPPLVYRQFHSRRQRFGKCLQGRKNAISPIRRT